MFLDKEINEVQVYALQIIKVWSRINISTILQGGLI